MVYFGEAQNKKLSLLSIAGGIVGAVVYVFRQKSLADKLALAAALGKLDVQGMAGVISILDKASGLPVPMLPEAAALRAPTDQLGTIYGVNHTHWAINHFSVDGRSAVDIIGAYQGGGELAAMHRPNSGSRG